MKRSLLKVIAILSCTVPPISAVLLYFPLWREMGAEAALCGFTVLLLILCMIPFFSTIKRALSSPSATTMWLMFFLIFALISKIAEQMTVISFVGYIGNLVGSVFFKLSERCENENKT